MDLRCKRLVSEDIDFEIFKSDVLHMISNDKQLSLRQIVDNEMINILWAKKWYLKALYLLAAVDYLSDNLKTGTYEKYNELRKFKSPVIVYPREALMLDALEKSDHNKNDAINRCRKSIFGNYFLKYNIVETGDIDE